VRVAALFDVHGNLPALEAVLAEVERADVDVIVSGGDVAAGPMPAECVDRLRGFGARVHWVRGNADREEALPDHLRESSGAFFADRLGPERRAFVAEAPLTARIEVDELGPVLFCHATPRSDEEIVTRLTPEDRLAEVLAGVEERTIVCGHTHVQFDRSAAGRRIVNAGSVGMPYEGRRGAFWACLGPEVELRRTEYDVEAAAEAIRATAYPEAAQLVGWLLEPPDPVETSEYFESLEARSAGT
jgi:putative phosphoesterase